MVDLSHLFLKHTMPRFLLFEAQSYWDTNFTLATGKVSFRLASCFSQVSPICAPVCASLTSMCAYSWSMSGLSFLVCLWLIHRAINTQHKQAILPFCCLPVLCVTMKYPVYMYIHIYEYTYFNVNIHRYKFYSRILVEILG